MSPAPVTRIVVAIIRIVVAIVVVGGIVVGVVVARVGRIAEIEAEGIRGPIRAHRVVSRWCLQRVPGLLAGSRRWTGLCSRRSGGRALLPVLEEFDESVGSARFLEGLQVLR
jgi:hypothetical protein